MQLKLALAESRRSRGKLIFSLFSIILGVAAITAVKTFTRSLESSISLQSRDLMGADVRIESNRPFPKDEPLTEALTKAGAAPYAQTTEFYTMIRLESKRRRDAALPVTKFVRVRAVRGNFPFYGNITEEPAGVYRRMLGGDSPILIADPTVFPALDLKPGDKVTMGRAEFIVGGSLSREFGGGSGMASGYAPPVYIHASYLERTGLLGTGSRIRYSRHFQLPAAFNAPQWKDDHWDQGARAGITILTYKEAAANIRRFMTMLSRFLTLSGLVILLLGGLGIGLAMNVFVRSKLDNVAIERALGATPGQTFRVYLILALLLGITGSVAGTAGGFGASALVASYGKAYFPVEVQIRPDLITALESCILGIATTLVFILRPIYAIRNVSPLRVLGRHADAGESMELARRLSLAGTLRRAPRNAWIWLRTNPAEAGFGGLIIAFMLLVSSTESDSLITGAFFTGGVLASMLLLWLLSRLIMRLAMRLLPQIKAYRFRQGIANLFRPGNQTATMIVATGTGVLLVASLYMVRMALESEMNFNKTGRPNVFMMDIQDTQRDSVQTILGRHNVTSSRVVPVVSMRIQAVNGRQVDRAEDEKDATRRNWENSLRSYEYFASFREHLIPSEKLTAGRFWTGRPDEQEISVDETWAKRMNVNLGDKLTLEVQGLPLSATVTSYRKVDWSAMQLNSILLFSPGDIELAPRMYIASLQVNDAKDRFRLQEELVRRHPNIAVIDAEQAVIAVRDIVDKIALVVRTMAGLTFAAGIIILAGAIGAGRFSRIRESMLFKTMGATARDIRTILVLEYAILGFAGGLAGLILSQILVAPLLSFFFEAAPVVSPLPLLLLVLGVSLLSVVIGMLVSRDVTEHKPLEVLRDEAT